MTKSFCHTDGDLPLEEVLTELVGVCISVQIKNRNKIKRYDGKHLIKTEI